MFKNSHEVLKYIKDENVRFVDNPIIDPFRSAKTLVMNFSIRDPFTDKQYSRDPRNVAAKAEAYLASTGIADTVSARVHEPDRQQLPPPGAGLRGPGRQGSL